MKAFKKRQAGVTLVEVILVLAVAAAITMMSIRQYETFRADRDLQQVLYNVDMLAQAAAFYYWANCGSRYYDLTVIPGTLSPYNTTTPPTNPFPLNITTDLINKGYLPAPLSLTANSITSSSSNYLVQFNRTMSERRVEACDDGPCATTSPHVIGTNVNWRIQISVQVPTASKAEALRDSLGAECLSALSSSTTVEPCRSAPAGANAYLVFTRAPAQAVPSSTSSIAENQINLQKFAGPQVTNTITNLTSSDHSDEYQYFVCSGY